MKLDLENLKKDLEKLGQKHLIRFVVLFGDENKYENYRLFAFKDYIDAEPLRELEIAMIQKCQDKLAETLSL